ncbi:hypothetical protein N9468_04630 [Flavobacteriaceae bacterium]|nr:hypothetical protein [Flavobacteriaceae bacterium]
MALVAVSGALQAVSAHNQGQYKAKVAERNSELANQDAKTAINQGRAEEAKRRIIVAQQIGKQRAQLAAQGLALGGGGEMMLSGDLVLADTAMGGEWEALAIRWQASELAKRYRLQAADYLSQRTMALRSAKSQVTATSIGTVGSLLSMGYSAYGLGSSTPSTPSFATVGKADAGTYIQGIGGAPAWTG